MDFKQATGRGPLGDERSADVAVPFRAAATDVLTALRVSVRGVMSDLVGVSKPADLQRALKLDQTLCWQLFKIIGPGDVLASGSAVPSRTSVERFLKAAKARGVEAGKLQQVLKVHEALETLIDVHAGDRVTFNSMVSAAGMDEEWHTTDLQHRRNMFRALSHSMGMRTKTRVQLTIIQDALGGEPVSDFAMITGVVDYRLLREFPRVRVYGMKTDEEDNNSPSRRPLIGDAKDNGYFLADYSTPLTTPLHMSESRTDAGALFQAYLDSPEVGKLGSKNLMFGEVWHRYPFETSRGWNMIITSAMEVVINDMLVMPGSLQGLRPKADVAWGVAGSGNPDARGAPIRGNFVVEHLGTGPDALATPDVPNYPAMALAAGRALGWDLDRAEAVRLRVEYPVYLSNVTIRWEPPAAS